MNIIDLTIIISITASLISFVIFSIAQIKNINTFKATGYPSLLRLIEQNQNTEKKFEKIINNIISIESKNKNYSEIRMSSKMSEHLDDLKKIASKLKEQALEVSSEIKKYNSFGGNSEKVSEYILGFANTHENFSKYLINYKGVDNLKFSLNKLTYLNKMIKKTLLIK